MTPARRRTVLVATGVLLLAAVAVVAMAVGRQPGGPVDQSAPGPVLVLPGYGGNTSDLDPLVAQLRSGGRVVVVFHPNQGGQGDLRVQAHRLADLAQRTLEKSGAGSVDIVGYSAGGVIARLYVKNEGGESVVRRVLTLGSPHHGTEVAALAGEVAGGCPTACEQMATGSDLLRRLNAGDETPDGPRWITVRTDADQTVTPTESAALQGALNIDVQAICVGATTSHVDLPSDPVVLATLGSALGAGAPKAPADVTC